MRCSRCYARCEDEFLHRVSGQCRAKPERVTKQDATWQQRRRKVREHSGPWPSAEHGTRSRYQGNSTTPGCRCEDCVAANYRYQKAWRTRRKATA